MQPSIQFEVNNKDINLLIKKMRVDTRQVPKALNQAINKTLKKAATISDTVIRESLNLKKQKVFKSFTIVSSSIAKLQGLLRVRGTPQPLIDFKDTKQTKKGVTFKVKKEKGRRLLKGAFIATMRSGHRGVFQRRFKTKGAGAKHGLPIDEKFTTTVMQAFTNRKVRAELFKLGESFLFPEFRRNIIRLTQKRGR